MARAITSHFGPDRARILLADPVGGPLAPLVPYLAQCVHIGLHLVVSRSTSGAMRAMMGPLLRRMWELGSPALLLSYPDEKGKFLGEAKSRTLPRGAPSW
ncbi:hypothetical protein [Streptomyces decoyicus]|uniref:hypothetical protein n=1 Tax=Streptomyces decoyicus TaxID=249567 RepID=UPI0033B24E7C